MNSVLSCRHIPCSTFSVLREVSCLLNNVFSTLTGLCDSKSWEQANAERDKLRFEEVFNEIDKDGSGELKRSESFFADFWTLSDSELPCSVLSFYGNVFSSDLVSEYVLNVLALAGNVFGNNCFFLTTPNVRS